MRAQSAAQRERDGEYSMKQMPRVNGTDVKSTKSCYAMGASAEQVEGSQFITINKSLKVGKCNALPEEEFHRREWSIDPSKLSPRPLSVL